MEQVSIYTHTHKSKEALTFSWSLYLIPCGVYKLVESMGQIISTLINFPIFIIGERARYIAMHFTTTSLVNRMIIINTNAQ